MNSNELRLNNLFRQKGSDFVETATFETFKLLSRGAIVIDGVPINEYWLDKFKYQDAFQIEKLNGFYFIVLISSVIPVFFIHQLQNLYLDLTGNELLIQNALTSQSGRSCQF